jgi:hypothetical protein
MIGRFLEKIRQSKPLLERIQEFVCKSDCPRCGKCVNLAEELGLEISGEEMNSARQKFIHGELMIDGVEYKPDPEKIRRQRIRHSINALLDGIAKK